MSHVTGNSRIQTFRLGLSLAVFAILISLASCRGTAAADDSQKTFTSPQEAGTALLEAAKSGDQASFLEIFGPSGKEVLFSGDPVKDRNALKNFATAYE